MSGQKTKTKRRSSFTANRVSLLSRDVSSAKDLHRMVEKELSKEDRLAKLTRLCLQYTVDTLAKEFKGEDWFDKFRVSAEEGGSEVISRLQDEDLFEHACSRKQQLPNPLNEDFNANIAAIEHNMNRLEEESVRWDALLGELKVDKEASDKKNENLELKAATLSEDVKTRAMGSYMKPSPDYQDLIQSTQTNLNKCALQMETYCKNVHLLERANKMADCVEEKQTQLLYKESFKGLNTQNSMQQISNLVSLPSPTKMMKHA
ncbi:uncharacterized protein LOC124115983 [Haliotis rufescens]|uniref:uncharacterized protein LOC124115983 n=1 Tax=Haliotis rufescens TaxID=6454 RepID=UPI001EAF9DCF|nr:uncharacterized protein LOC124115983 [Haliotis rufescens]XP_046333128.1 uncharacterized protein LOC124115983 [Haliotis rufescens]XP_046333129.1 uncharacterized protein LOC124115983 [Haliotis rufescens]XP_048245396.1 uncharacterized protein LOC124115983 [Haliotis rufescens]XP_048245397.1 uncharacterized protein LOC124115983 [Haliotis rufescens]